MDNLAGQEQVVALLGNMTELAVQYGFDLLGAILILIAGWVVAGWARSSLRRAMDKATRIDATLKPFFANAVRYIILILVLVAVLAQFGVQTASIIAMLGAAGLAVGLALQGTLQNIAAGIMLLFLRPFRIGDYIDAQGLAGTVDEIGLFTIKLRTFDGVYVEAPNSMVWNRAITNYSRLPTRRVDVVVGISYGDDIGKAQAALLDLLRQDQRVHGEPAPQVLVKTLADSAVEMNLRCWTNAGDYWPLLFDLNKNAKLRVEAEGMTIPFPQRDVHVQETAKPAPRKRATQSARRP